MSLIKITLWLKWAAGIGTGEFRKGARICKVAERTEWKDNKNIEIEGELLMMGYKVKEGRRCTQVEESFKGFVKKNTYTADDRCR